ncbi:MAG: hypothetical protein P4M00_03925 [Azospirillaceae bacterium]|nr:hypothetical protein [Azospirillaceae bacterium]
MSQNRFDEFLRQYATQATAALSVIVAVTGVILFFFAAHGPITLLHEWLGLVFVVVAILHGWRHRRVIATYLGQNRTRVMAGTLVAVVAAVFTIVPSENGGALRKLITRVQAAPLADVAPVLGVSAEDMIGALTAKGLRIDAEKPTLASIATTNHLPLRRLLEIMAEIQP